MAMNKITYSQSLDLLRFPLAVIIVIVHVFNSDGITFQGVTSGFEAYPFFMGVNRFVDGFLRSQSVPIYYFISGYVFFLGGEMTRGVYLRKFRNRVNTLLIPYFVWNLFALLILVVTVVPPFNQFRSNASEFTPSLHGFSSAFWMYDGSLEGVNMTTAFPISQPLWFVRNLIIVILCTPLIHFILKKTKYYMIVVLGVFWFVANSCHIKTYDFDVAFLFFSWGGYMSINQKNMVTVFQRFFKISVVLYIILGVTYMMVADTMQDVAVIVKKTNIVVGLIFAYNLSTWLLQNNKCKVNPTLSSASFFLYLAHGHIARIILKLSYTVIRPESSFYLLTVHVFTVILTISVLLLAFYLLKRYTPHLLNALTGRK
jgi:fucose 4-O-acetylase-like acetyltransferase